MVRIRHFLVTRRVLSSAKPTMNTADYLDGI